MAEPKYSVRIADDSFQVALLTKRLRLNELGGIYSAGGEKRFVESTIIHQNPEFAIAIVHEKTDLLINPRISGLFNNFYILFENALLLKYSFDLASDKHYMGFTAKELDAIGNNVRATCMGRFLLSDIQSMKHFLTRTRNIREGNK